MLKGPGDFDPPEEDPLFELDEIICDNLELYRQCSECGSRIYYTNSNNLNLGQVYHPWFDPDGEFYNCCSAQCQGIMEADYDEESEEVKPSEKNKWWDITRKPFRLTIDDQSLIERIKDRSY